MQGEFKKLKVGMWILVFLGPIGIFALQAVNFAVRYDWLIAQDREPWQMLLHQINIFLTPAILLGTALLASLIAGMEHETGAWRRVLTLPISRISVYFTKFIVTGILLFISTCLTFGGTIIFGYVFSWEQSIPYGEILINSFYPYFAALPVLGLQLWLSVTMKNQGSPLTFGITGAVVSLYLYGGPEWLIWKWPYLENQWDIPEISVLLGVIVGLLSLVVGAIDFNRRDVN
nr:ABC transporter permease [Bacillus alkalicola]